MTKSRSLLALGTLVLALSGFVVAQVPFLNDVTGRWNVQVEAPGQTMASALVLQQQGDSVTGRFQSEVGETPVWGEMRGDTLVFGMNLNMQGQTLEIWGRGVLRGEDEMRGNLDISGMGTIPFTARRAR